MFRLLSGCCPVTSTASQNYVFQYPNMRTTNMAAEDFSSQLYSALPCFQSLIFKIAPPVEIMSLYLSFKFQPHPSEFAKCLLATFCQMLRRILFDTIAHILTMTLPTPNHPFAPELNFGFISKCLVYFLPSTCSVTQMALKVT